MPDKNFQHKKGLGKINGQGLIFSCWGKRCRLCGQLLTRNNQKISCCSDCLKRLPMRTQGFCPGCGKVFDTEKGIFFCSACLIQTKPWSAFAFYGLYEGFLRDLILAFKFANCLSLRAVLAHHLFWAYRYHLETSSPDLIVPVPLHHKRLAERGFNQSLELAKLLGVKLACKVTSHALIRIRYTPPQSNLRRRQRLLNIRGAICADKKMVRGQRILLVDDIYTTGTTLEVCADALLEAGCSCVEVIVLARAF